VKLYLKCKQNFRCSGESTGKKTEEEDRRDDDDDDGSDDAVLQRTIDVDRDERNCTALQSVCSLDLPGFPFHSINVDQSSTFAPSDQTAVGDRIAASLLI